MSWSSLITASHVEAGVSASESRRFGLEIGRVNVPAGAAADLAQVGAAVEEMGVDLVVLRYPARHTDWFAHLVERFDKVLLADSLVYWSLEVGSGRRPDLRYGVDCRRSVAPDSLVDDLVAGIFADYGSHYTANPRLDPALALAGYQEWARTSVARDGGVVLELDGRAVGLATTHGQGSALEIELAGLLGPTQGQGLYPHLLAAVEEQAASSSATEVVISTQGHNTRVQRAWAAYGFRPVETFLTVHIEAVRPPA